MKKIDFHVHCASNRTELSFGNPMDVESHYVCNPSELLETMEEHQIERAVLMSGGETFNHSAFNLGATNEECWKISMEYPEKLFWMCNFDPISPETIKDRMAECRALGAVGVGEITLNQWMDSEFLSALFAAAEELKMPVTCHMSPKPGIGYGVCDRAGLPLLEKTLQKFPNLKMMGHSQVFWLEISADCPVEPPAARNGYGKGAVVLGGVLDRLFSSYPNLYGDLSAYSAYCAITRDPAYGLAFLEKHKNQLFFGTDMMNRRTVPPLGKFLDDMAASGRLSSETYEKICFDNAELLLGIK